MKTKLDLLILEDETNLGLTLKDFLERQGHQVFWADTIQKAQAEFIKTHFDVAILDINLPDGSGLDLGQWLRRQRKETVILFCSALNDPKLKVQGLEMGAEDYITKPFELKELMLRLDRLFKARELSLKNPDEWKFGKLIFWPRRFEVQTAQEEVVSLGQKECAILGYLLEKKNEVVSRDELIEAIWGEEAFPTNRTVDNYMVKLRKWMETDSSHPLNLQSVRGVGYKLEIKGESK